MSLKVNSNPDAETVGVSPKTAWPTLALVAMGVLLAVLDRVVLGDDVPDEVWLTLIAAGGGAGVFSYSAPAAVQRSKTTP